MKHKLLFAHVLSCMVCMVSNAQPNMEGKSNLVLLTQKEGKYNDNRTSKSGDYVEGNRAYEIIVQRVESEKEVLSRNSTIRGFQEMQEQQSRGEIGDALGSALKIGYGSLATQKAVNLTSNLINYTVDFIGTAIKKHKERFNNWYSTSKSYRTFTQTLSQQQMIGDFYALPSNKGAFDPENIAFKGIGCRSYFSTEGKNGVREKHDEYCYVFCSLRTDSIGLQSIVNHSKFMLEIDSIYFRPNICDIPSHMSGRVSRYNNFFEKHEDLRVTLNVKIYSSWFNEAIMLQRDQLLGNFDIIMKIDSADCVWKDGERVFIYTKSDSAKYQPSADKSVPRQHLSEISITGESFIVPRSFSTNANSDDYSPVWGTGEYRVELTLSESSDLNKNYYYADEYKPNRNSGTAIGNGRQVAFANIPGKKFFDKNIWKSEWVDMKSAKKKMTNGKGQPNSFLQGAWANIYSTIKGTSWTTTFLSPAVTAITTVEAQVLNKKLGLNSTASSSAALKQQGTQSAPSNNSGGNTTQTPPSNPPTKK